MLAYIFATGALPDILQATFFGVAGAGGTAAAAILLSLLHDLLLAAPLLVLARHPAGVLHPIIVAIVLWPLLTQVPNTIDGLGGYGGMLAGEPLRPPHFIALSWHDTAEAWRDIMIYRGIEVLALGSIFAGIALAAGHKRQRRIAAFADLDTHRLRTILAAIILANLAAVWTFLALRGGLVDHIAQLSFGRFRTLAGLGPLLALFDMSVVCLLIWICYRPGDAKSPLFLALLLVVAAQQFVVAGSRSSMLVVFVVVGLGWMMRSGRVPWRLALLLLPVAFASFGVLNIVRNAGLSGTTAVEAASALTLQDIAERSRNEFDQRQALAGSVPVTTDAVRSGLMLGQTYGGALFAAVPRTIWEEKPRGPGAIYAQAYLGEAREGMSVPVSPAAEAFWNFHVPGVIVLFALYGCAVQMACRLFEANRDNGMVVAAFVLFVRQFGVGTEQLVACQQTVLTFAVVMLVLLTFRQKSGGRAAAPSTALRAATA